MIVGISHAKREREREREREIETESNLIGERNK